MKHSGILALALAALLALAPAVALADGGKVSVSGTGAVNLKPDTATITLGVSETPRRCGGGPVQRRSRRSTRSKSADRAGTEKISVSLMPTSGQLRLLRRDPEVDRLHRVAHAEHHHRRHESGRSADRRRARPAPTNCRACPSPWRTTTPPMTRR